MMGWMDIMLAAPALVLVIVLTSTARAGSLFNVTLAISILSVPAFARVASAQTLVFNERDFVKAARALGARNRRIIVKEIVPNIAPSLFAYVLIVMASADRHRGQPQLPRARGSRPRSHRGAG